MEGTLNAGGVRRCEVLRVEGGEFRVYCLATREVPRLCVTYLLASRSHIGRHKNAAFCSRIVLCMHVNLFLLVRVHAMEADHHVLI